MHGQPNVKIYVTISVTRRVTQHHSWFVFLQTLSLQSRAESSVTIAYRVNTASNTFDTRLNRHVSYFLRYYLERYIRVSSLSPLTGYHNRDIPSFLFTSDTSSCSALK
jgi:hypothetical protein